MSKRCLGDYQSHESSSEVVESLQRHGLGIDDFIITRILFSDVKYNKQVLNNSIRSYIIYNLAP